MKEISEEPWTDDAEQFLKERGLRYLNVGESLNPVSFVHSVYSKSGLRETSIEDFINGINAKFHPAERMCRVRSVDEPLSPSVGRGMDALSAFLLELNPTKHQYERVMRSANRGYLTEIYRAESLKLI